MNQEKNYSLMYDLSVKCKSFALMTEILTYVFRDLQTFSTFWKQKVEIEKILMVYGGM